MLPLLYCGETSLSIGIPKKLKKFKEFKTEASADVSILSEGQGFPAGQYFRQPQYYIETEREEFREMAFFEQLGKRLTDAGQGVAQQTKNFADVTRLNSEISEKEKKIAQLYQAIGQSYYERHTDEPAPEHREAVGEIKALFAEIAQCREEIKQIRGIVKCPNCGADVPLQAAFCNACGAKMEAAPAQPAAVAEGTKICPACGAASPKDNRFCTRCGAKFDETEQQEG